MKKNVLTLVVALLCTINVIKAQTDIIDVTFDYTTKKFTGLDKLEGIEQGGWYRLKITGINLNLYKVTLGKSDSVVESDIKTPDFLGFNLDNLASLAGGLLTGQVLSSAAVNSIAGNKSNTNINSPILSPDTSKIKIPEVVKKITARMQEEKTYLEEKTKEIGAIKTSIDDLYFNVNKFLLLSKVESNTSADYTALNSTTFDLASALKTVTKNREDILKIQNEINDKSKKYISFSEDNKADIEKYKLKDNDGKIKETYVKMAETLTKASESVNAENANKLLSSMVMQNNNKNFEYLSMPMQFTGDFGKLKITLKPLKEDAALQTYEAEINFPSPKNDYVGVGMSFYVSGLYDDLYSVTETTVDSTASYSLVSEDVVKAEFGTAMLLRYGWKSKKKEMIGGHFTFGTAVSISNSVKPRIILGGGLSVGEKHMLVFDIGAIAGYSNKLSKAYSTEKMYSAKPEQTLVSKLNASLFFSLGYLYRF